MDFLIWETSCKGKSSYIHVFANANAMDSFSPAPDKSLILRSDRAVATHAEFANSCPEPQSTVRFDERMTDSS